MSPVATITSNLTQRDWIQKRLGRRAMERQRLAMEGPGMLGSVATEGVAAQVAVE